MESFSMEVRGNEYGQPNSMYASWVFKEKEKENK